MDKTKYPKVTQHLGQWIQQKAKLHGQPQQVIEGVPIENMIDLILGTNAPVLRDYLQEHHIYTGCIPYEDITSNKIVWKWRVIGTGPTTESSCEDRSEAESKTLEQALNRLETRL